MPQEGAIPHFDFDAAPLDHVFALRHLELSINEDPGRLLNVLNGMSSYPTPEEVETEPIIDLIMLATHEESAPTFDEESERAIRAALAPKVGIAAIQAAAKGERPLDGHAMRRARLEQYIRRVTDMQKQTDSELVERKISPIRLPGRTASATRQSNGHKKAGKSGSPAA